MVSFQVWVFLFFFVYLQECILLPEHQNTRENPPPEKFNTQGVELSKIS